MAITKIAEIQIAVELLLLIVEEIRHLAEGGRSHLLAEGGRSLLAEGGRSLLSEGELSLLTVDERHHHVGTETLHPIVTELYHQADDLMMLMIAVAMTREKIHTMITEIERPEGHLKSANLTEGNLQGEDLNMKMTIGSQNYIYRRNI